LTPKAVADGMAWVKLSQALSKWSSHRGQLCRWARGWRRAGEEGVPQGAVFGLGRRVGGGLVAGAGTGKMLAGVRALSG
jgi:hypothetical protein